MKLILTCEHGGNDIPKNYKSLFKNNPILHTHRAYDLGALDLFKSLQPLSNASFYSTTSRLLIELNRSLHHTHLFSEYTKQLTPKQKSELINRYYLPYRNAVEQQITSCLEQQDTVLHLSIHSFTPRLHGIPEIATLGLLYDSRNSHEQHFCKDFKSNLIKQDPTLKIRSILSLLGKSRRVYNLFKSPI